jgi:protocatechuate 4,5-dioxygenase, alpha chain
VDDRPEIPGTTLFDAVMARRGYALNKMCFSFNAKANRDAFLADPESYMHSYGLTEEQAAAVRSLQVLDLLTAGGNAYYLAKLAGIYGLDMQDIGAQQTGMTKEEFKAKLAAAAQQC